MYRLPLLQKPQVLILLLHRCEPSPFLCRVPLSTCTAFFANQVLKNVQALLPATVCLLLSRIHSRELECLLHAPLDPGLLLLLGIARDLPCMSSADLQHLHVVRVVNRDWLGNCNVHIGLGAIQGIISELKFFVLKGRLA